MEKDQGNQRERVSDPVLISPLKSTSVLKSRRRRGEGLKAGGDRRKCLVSVSERQQVKEGETPEIIKLKKEDDSRLPGAVFTKHTNYRQL